MTRIDVLEDFLTKSITCKVSKESMITFNKFKYSIYPKYIGNKVISMAKTNTFDF